MNNRQLTFAREYRGYSQTELADKIEGLSQSNLSKFEKGFGVLSSELISKIIEFLDFPKEFFDKKIICNIENANYRKRSTINKSTIQHFENKCKLIGYSIDELSETIEWPNFTLCQINIEDGYSASYVATYTRKLLNLHPGEPIKDIISILEAKGIIIYELSCEDKFDGVSFISDKGYSIIVLNKNLSNDRKRFTIAHELGHLLLHKAFPISEYREKLIENEANEFASEFLMPKEYIRSSLVGLRMNTLPDLKKYWLTSMSSIIRKAKDLDCIDSNRYKFFMIEMSRFGYSKNEPIEVDIDKPNNLKFGYELLKDKLGYSVEDFINYLSLPKDVINELFSIDNNVKLRIVHWIESEFKEIVSQNHCKNKSN